MVGSRLSIYALKICMTLTCFFNSNKVFHQKKKKMIMEELHDHPSFSRNLHPKGQMLGNFFSIKNYLSPLHPYLLYIVQNKKKIDQFNAYCWCLIIKISLMENELSNKTERKIPTYSVKSLGEFEGISAK